MTFSAKCYSRRSFTLVELLIVVAIIMILMALLMPGLKRAKETASSVLCKSNMKQILLAETSYATDNNGWVHAGYNGLTSDWDNHLLAESIGGYTFGGPYIENPNVLYCPYFVSESSPGGYGYCQDVFHGNPSLRSSHLNDAGTTSHYFIRFDRLPNPASEACLGDSRFAKSYTDKSTKPHGMQSAIWRKTSWFNNDWRRGLWCGHCSRANIGFADMHVADYSSHELHNDLGVTRVILRNWFEMAF